MSFYQPQKSDAELDALLNLSWGAAVPQTPSSTRPWPQRGRIPSTPALAAPFPTHSYPNSGYGVHEDRREEATSLSAEGYDQGADVDWPSIASPPHLPSSPTPFLPRPKDASRSKYPEKFQSHLQPPRSTLGTAPLPSFPQLPEDPAGVAGAMVFEPTSAGPRPAAVSTLHGRRAADVPAVEHDGDMLLGMEKAHSLQSDGRTGSPQTDIMAEPIATTAVLQKREEVKKLASQTGESEFLPTTALNNDAYKKLFQYTTFNKMQSRVFESAYKSDENLVVCAPTGSGKTTVFELAFLKMLSDGDAVHKRNLAIYIAPTRALCSERYNDWSVRFKDLLYSRDEKGSPVEACVCITGDSLISWAAFKKIRNASLVITTPEKLDSLTRRKEAISKNFDSLALLMIDEVHILQESRGATLEVVVSRLKLSGDRLRFVALSASVPNVDDVARWMGGRNETISTEEGVYEGGGAADMALPLPTEAGALDRMPKAKVFKFGEEFRPTKLVRITQGYDAHGEWALQSKLDKEIYSVLMQYGLGKPIMIFCPTRKSCQSTAEVISRFYQDSLGRKLRLPWQCKKKRDGLQLQDVKIQELTKYGIAVHHAGLELNDRRKIEEGYRSGDLMLLCSTSTLAVGVNLPAYLVIIKGTTTWTGVGTGHREYSDIDIQQMMGRAGRPQFEDSGTVVVMCAKNQVSRYKDIMASKTILESSLHQNLTEHINSEIGLGTINSLDTAIKWLQRTFLYIRIQQNPAHYTVAMDGKSCDDWLEGFAKDTVRLLEDEGLVQYDELDDGVERTKESRVISTEIGHIMSQSFISFQTMQQILRLPGVAGLRDLLEVVAGAYEFRELRIRPGEASMLNKLRTDQLIDFHLEEPVKTYADKVFILLQMLFGGVNAPDKEKSEVSSIAMSQGVVYQAAPRIAKAMARVFKYKAMDVDETLEFGHRPRMAKSLRHTIELQQIIVGKAWPHTAMIFKQLGLQGLSTSKMCHILEEHDIRTFPQLAHQDPAQIEAWIKRTNGTGKKIVQAAASMPILRVRIEEIAADQPQPIFSEPPTVKLNVLVSLGGGTPWDFSSEQVKRYKDVQKWTIRPHWQLFVLVYRSDGIVLFCETLQARQFKVGEHDVLPVTAEISDHKQKIHVLVGIEEIVGCSDEAVYDPEYSEEAFAQIQETQEVGDHAHTDAREEVDPADRYPNGNIRCNHSCKDRDICHHRCCREGVKPKKSGVGVPVRHNPIPATLAAMQKIQSKPEEYDDDADEDEERGEEAELENVRELSAIPQKREVPSKFKKAKLDPTEKTHQSLFLPSGSSPSTANPSSESVDLTTAQPHLQAPKKKTSIAVGTGKKRAVPEPVIDLGDEPVPLKRLKTAAKADSGKTATAPQTAPRAIPQSDNSDSDSDDDDPFGLRLRPVTPERVKIVKPKQMTIEKGGTSGTRSAMPSTLKKDRRTTASPVLISTSAHPAKAPQVVAASPLQPESVDGLQFSDDIDMDFMQELLGGNVRLV